MNLRLLYFVFCVLSYRFSSAQRLVSKGKTVTASSTFWDIGRAVDGNTDRGADRCHCCAATNKEEDPWYKLDLGQQYKIYSISVLGRGGAGDGGYGNVLLNMEIKLGTTQSDGQVLTTNTDNVYVYNFTLPTPQEGRYLTLTLLTPPGTTQFFVICELLVYGDCIDGRYGSDCQEICGKCENNDPCNTGNGTCLSCRTGYESPLCQECNDGYFGNDCTQRCYCLSSPCNKFTGICPIGGCKEGFTGNKCDTPCEYGKYGKNCEMGCGSCYNNATCDIFSGNCQKCSPGYRGSQCKQICRNGTYGQDCREMCGLCYNNEACNHVDGRCSSCTDGYKGADCKTECDSRTFGLNCSQNCGHCFNSSQCNTVNGSCPAGCDPGFKGDLCDATCPVGKFGRNCISSCGNCLNNTICSRFDGSCDPGCELGYKPPFCQQECEDGFYGLECNARCGRCLNGETCDKRNGICSQCEHGYMEPLCKVPQNTEFKARCPEVKGYQIATAIVGTVAAVVIIGIVVAAICYVIRRRRKHRERPIQSQPVISNPYEMVNRGAFENEHQYGQTAPVYEVPEVPDEIPK